MHEIGVKAVLICTRPEKLAPTGPHSWRIFPCLLYSGILVRCQLSKGLIVAVFRNIRSREELNIFVSPNRLCTLSIADCLYSGIQAARWLIDLYLFLINSQNVFICAFFVFFSICHLEKIYVEWWLRQMQSPSIRSQVLSNNTAHVYVLNTKKSLFSNSSTL